MTPLVLVGADTGGTFTDLVALVRGRPRVLKVRSTPNDPAAAVRAGLATLAAGSRRMRLHYGSTVATNALLERRGARVVLLTTAGFEDVLEIGRQVRPRLHALEPSRPEPLVPRLRRVGIRERVRADGSVERRLAAREAARAARKAGRLGADAVAVCLLHSYLRPEHEIRLGRALEAAGLHVTLSHRLLREYREYERTATTVANAYVGPVMTRHLTALAESVSAGVRVMQSSGGLVGAATASAEAVRTVLSGPAGGVAGAVDRARRAGFRRVITLDMGGTSADVSLVDGAPAHRSETTIAGLPIRVPAIDIHTVGAGGGSLARLDRGGALRVGPESAGADPGPACFGRGTAPTVTDANLVLGRLVATEFLGGALRLDAARAREALAPLARRLRRSLVATALGIVRVATAAMERAVRVVSVERGFDPRDFVLVAFGGAGAVHAAELAAGLGVRRVLVPRQPGLLSAWGVLGAEVVLDYGRTLRAVDPGEATLRAAFHALAAQARRGLRREGVRDGLLEPSLEVRYAGQAYELLVPWTPGWARAFHRLHARLYHHAHPGRPLEVITVRLRARGGASVAPVERMPSTGAGRPVGRQAATFDDGAHATPVYRRDDLPPGWRARGPAIVCEYSATTVVPPGWRLTVERAGSLLLERRP